MRLTFAIFLLLFALAIFAPPRHGAGLFWDGANALGLAGFAGLLALMGGVAGPHGFRRHELVGYAALGLIFAHSFWLMLGDAALAPYLRLSAPLHMWAGLVALLATIWLVAFSRPKDRKPIHKDRAAFRRTHLAVSVIAIGAAMLHILKSGFYFSTPAQIALVIIGSLAAMIAARKGPPAFTRGLSLTVFLCLALGAALVFTLAKGALK